MATFSWTDTFHIAVSSCLPCLSHRSTHTGTSSTDSLLTDNNNSTHRIPRARPDELQGLLADANTDVDADPYSTDTDAERMSMHSNPGRLNTHKRTKKRKIRGNVTRNAGSTKKRITLFGYALFGQANPPPIHLPESDEEEEDGEVDSTIIPTTRSSSTSFDQDAAPLSSSAIAKISSSSSAIAALLAQREAEALAEEEKRRYKAERKAQRRERKEMKRRLERALGDPRAAGGVTDGEFEGFQGSGGEVYSARTLEGYGPFVQARFSEGGIGIGVDEEGDAALLADADFDGGLYARKREDEGASGSRSGSGSDSRSRTSASRSDLAYTVAYNNHRQHHHQPQPKPQHKRSTTTKKSHSSTSGSTSRSPSIPSPTSPSFTLPYSQPHPLPSKQSVVKQVHPDFDGSQGFGGGGLPSPGIRRIAGGDSSFPSQGLGGPGKIQRRDSILVKGGAFLATRGTPGDVDG